MTAYRRIKVIMEDAGFAEGAASPKALRHGFAVAALEQGVPLVLIQRWLGHATWKTTAIYTELVGAEERKFAELLWRQTRSRTALSGDEEELDSTQRPTSARTKELASCFAHTNCA